MLENGIPANVIRFPAIKSQEASDVLGLALNVEQALRIQQNLEQLSVAASRLGCLSQNMGLLARHLDSRLSSFNIPQAPSPQVFGKPEI